MKLLVLGETAHPLDRCKGELMLGCVLKLYLRPDLSILRMPTRPILQVADLGSQCVIEAWHKIFSCGRAGQRGSTGGVWVS